MNILVVSQEKNIGAVMRAYLQGAGNRVSIVETLSEANRLLEESSFEAMFVDENARGETTFSLLREIHKTYPLLPIIWLGDFAEDVQLKDLGIARVIEKPFALPELQIVLRELDHNKAYPMQQQIAHGTNHPRGGSA